MVSSEVSLKNLGTRWEYTDLGTRPVFSDSDIGGELKRPGNRDGKEICLGFPMSAHAYIL